MLQNSHNRARTALLLLALVVPLSALSSNHAEAARGEEKKCLYVSSYHQGDEWSDEIEASIRATLQGRCELQTVDMDTNPNKSPEFIFESTNRIIKTIEDWQPDVVTVSYTHLTQPTILLV